MSVPPKVGGTRNALERVCKASHTLVPVLPDVDLVQIRHGEVLRLVGLRGQGFRCKRGSDPQQPQSQMAAEHGAYLDRREEGDHLYCSSSRTSKKRVKGSWKRGEIALTRLVRDDEPHGRAAQASRRRKDFHVAIDTLLDSKKRGNTEPAHKIESRSSSG